MSLMQCHIHGLWFDDDERCERCFLAEAGKEIAEAMAEVLGYQKVKVST